VWDGIASRTDALATGLRAAAERAGVPIIVQHVGTMLTLFFTDAPVTSWDTARAADTKKYAAFFRRMLEQGVYFPPSQFEAAFVSSAHSDGEIDRTIHAAGTALQS
jgi:glutamate-1-semialdehyde 2,1-aminomutase